MKIVVVGCGKIGTSVISNIVNEGHNVVAVDTDPKVVKEISNIYDVICVCGNAVDYDTLNEADAGSCDMFIAVTGSDEFNMLSCFIAKKIGAKNTFARIRNPEYNDNNINFLRSQLELSLCINPDLLLAKELFNILKLPSAVNIETFCGGNFEMVEILIKKDTPLCDIKISDLRKKYPANFLICVVWRGEEVYIPDGNFVLKEGDKIGLTASPIEIQKLLKRLGILQKQARDVMIFGGSRSSYYLAKMLIESGNNVKIIESNNNRCIELCNDLPDAVIINGDGTSKELLFEEGLRSMDAFVSLTGMDEENVLISIFASSENVPKVITKINRNEIASMALKLGLDCVVSPAKIISDQISSFARALQNSEGSKVERLYKLMDNKAEALQFEVTDDFPFLAIPLKEIKIKKNILISGIIRKRKPIIPSGDDVITVGDKVIVIATGHMLEDLSDIIDRG